MDVNALATGAFSGASSPSKTGSDAATLASDFDTFLKMLTAQARYQDPLEPIDSSEYAAQLAQFSMVEQQVMANDLLSAMAAQLGQTGMASMAGWIGKEARTAAPVSFSGDPIPIAPNPAAVADEVFLVVTDEAGNEIDRVSIPVSAAPYQWDGLNNDGLAQESGIYNFTVESWSENEMILSEPAESYARITEIRSLAGETIIVLQGGVPVQAGSVTAIREPSDSGV